MKVGIVIERMEPWRGGAETSTAQFAAELLAAGCQVALFTASRGLSEPGVEVHTVEVRGSRARQAVGFRAAVEAALAEHPCDVVHSMTALCGGDVFMPRGGTIAETLEGNLRARKTPLARDLKRLTQLLSPKQRALLKIEKDLLTRRPPARVVALSHYVARQLQEHYGLSAPRVVEVFNGVTVPAVEPDARAAARVELRAKWHVPDEALLLLFVAHNFKLKGLGPLIDAVGRLTQRQPSLDWRLLVVGRDRPNSYVGRADSWHISDRVTFTGHSERASQFYLASDLLVLPSFYDPCSRVVLEAISLGTPAITSRYNGAGEVLNSSPGRPAAGSVIADPHDADELAAAIAAYADAGRRRAAGQSGLDLREQLSMRRHAAEMIEIYQQVLAERSGGRSS